jgi:hypothetical protein
MKERVYVAGLALLALVLGLAACGQALDATATATEASPTEQAPEEQAPAAEPSPPATEVPAYAWNQLLSRDSIRPIYDPEFVPANEAGYNDDELVMGVALDGEAKAYPISLLNSREMVNDELAGTAILVSW